LAGYVDGVGGVDGLGLGWEMGGLVRGEGRGRGGEIGGGEGRGVRRVRRLGGRFSMFGSGGGVGAGLTRAGFVGVDDFEVGHFWGGGSEVEGAVVVGRNSAVEVGGWLWRGKMEGLEGSGEEFLVRAEHEWDFLWLLIPFLWLPGDTLDTVD